MKRLIFILALLAGATLQAQYTAPVFDNSPDTAAVDSAFLTAAAPSETGEQIMFAGGIRGSATLWGLAKAVAGTDSVITIEARPLFYRKHNGFLTLIAEDTWESVGTHTTSTSDTTVYSYNLSGLSWWKRCNGYQTRYTIPGGASANVYVEAYELHE